MGCQHSIYVGIEACLIYRRLLHRSTYQGWLAFSRAFLTVVLEIFENLLSSWPFFKLIEVNVVKFKIYLFLNRVFQLQAPGNPTRCSKNRPAGHWRSLICGQNNIKACVWRVSACVCVCVCVCVCAMCVIMCVNARRAHRWLAARNARQRVLNYAQLRPAACKKETIFATSLSANSSINQLQCGLTSNCQRPTGWLAGDRLINLSRLSLY